MATYKASEMTFKDVLKLLEEDGANVSTVAKQIEGISEKPLRKLLKDNGFEFHNTGVKGWHYVADASNHETVLNSVLKSDKQAPAPRKKRQTPIKATPPATTTPPPATAHIERRRHTFDLDNELMKQVKVHAILTDKNVYDIVEIAIREYMDKVK